MPYRILLRRDNSAKWIQNDPVLMLGEPGYETDTGKLKIGDGQTPWSSLQYYGGGEFVNIKELYKLLSDKQDRLQNISGNIGVGILDVDATEKLDVNGYVKATGFKTLSGTSTQALTADGGVFDLNEKANIVDIPTKTSFTHDILVANWTLVSGKYEAVISNSGILANSFVDVIPSNDNVDIVRSAQIYPSVLISAGSVKVYSKFLPSDIISVTVNIN